MTRKTVPLPDAAWVSDYVSPTSHRHALLAEKVHVAPDELRGEGRVLAALIEVGRQVVEEQAQRATYDQMDGDVSPDHDADAAFILYDSEADKAFAAADAVWPSAHEGPP